MKALCGDTRSLIIIILIFIITIFRTQNYEIIYLMLKRLSK